MSGETSPPHLARARPRQPSGPRSRPTFSSRHSSSSSIPSLTHRSSREDLSGAQRPLGLNSQLDTIAQSPVDLYDGEQQVLTVSPESSPRLRSDTSSPPVQQSPPGQSKKSAKDAIFRSHTPPISSLLEQVRSTTAPLRISRPASPAGLSFTSRPNTPGSPPPVKPRPQPTRLNTNVQLPETSSPTKPVSPGVKHWQHVRQHVLAPSPISENARNSLVRPVPKRSGLVDKARGRFGLRNAAESVMGYPDRRVSVMGLPEVAGMSAKEQEDAARERRVFARDVKTCLDACSTEESKRRIARLAQQAANGVGTRASAVYGSANLRFVFDPDFSAFAPLLLELHRYLPAARAKRIWSRTCPHHAAILAELQVAFLSDTASTSGERQQILEIFGVIVKNWAADSEEEELHRWLWLCRAMTVGDRQLRNRGLALLSSCLNADPSLPRVNRPPSSALAFIALATALLGLFRAVKEDPTAQVEHIRTIQGYLSDLVDGNVIEVEDESLATILPEVDHEGHGDLPRELMWMAAIQSLVDTYGTTASSATMGLDNLSSHAPSPILPGTPPLVLHLRAQSALLLLHSASRLLSSKSQPVLWSAIQQYVIDELDRLPDAHGHLAEALGRVVFEIELAQYSASIAPPPDDNPFQVDHILSEEVTTSSTTHRDILIAHADVSADDSLSSAFFGAAKAVVTTGEISQVCQMVRYLLDSTPLAGLARRLLPLLLDRIATQDSVPLRHAEILSMITWLRKSHPQLFYKPLFSLSASSQPIALTKHLRITRYLAKTVGAESFWLDADPQMVAVVLAGDTNPKAGTSHGDSTTTNAEIRLGRYACLVELVDGPGKVLPLDSKKASRRKFAEALEARFGAVLEAEDANGILPAWYRALACQLLFCLRGIARSTKRSTWLRIVLRWYLEPSDRPDHADVNAATLASIYRSAGADGGSHSGTPLAASPTKAPTTAGRQDSTSIISLHVKEQDSAFALNIATLIPRLLVLVQACLSRDEWAMLLPVLWAHLGRRTSAPVAFLFIKCGQVIPDEFRSTVFSDLSSSDFAKRLAAMRKIALLYALRYQIAAQDTISDRRGPTFHFPTSALDYVATDIGSAVWVPPQDVQDAALKRFGPSLPLELRQRLLELGWSEDKDVEDNVERERIPLTSLATLHLQPDSADIKQSSPHKSLGRQSSDASANSVTLKRRRAVFPPALFELVNRLSTSAKGPPHHIAACVGAELIIELQRDDHAHVARSLSEGFNGNFVQQLATINLLLDRPTPAFAFTLLNALTGFLKSALRSPKPFEPYAATLSTIVRLIPHVSEFSLRNIRKSKAEHVLLPASIHEDEGGFKLHRSWQEARYDVQTAQILVLIEVLKVNPREVYLVKKMVANLQIQSSIDNLSFSRAWCLLIVQLFTTLNRNYNDRAELRHLLTNVAAILSKHGSTDLLVVTQAMRIFALCALRFRRVFASIGFGIILRAILETYTNSLTAARDCIEYCFRAFYRVHEDMFVYQVCLAMAENRTDHTSAYRLLCCLSIGSSLASGVASGIRGLPDDEELDMLKSARSGPGHATKDMQVAADTRDDGGLRSPAVDDKLFPKENIIKLITTLIAANPAAKRAAKLLDLFVGFVPYMVDPRSSGLLTDAVQALGTLISHGRAEAVSLPGFQAAEEDSAPDWIRTKRGYIRLVECYARNGGQLNPPSTRYTLDFIVDVLRDDPIVIAPLVASVIYDIAKPQLRSPTAVGFLHDFAPVFRLCIKIVDFSRFLECLTTMVIASDFEPDSSVARLIVDSYLASAIQALAEAADERTLFDYALRQSAVELLSAAVYLKQVDAFELVQRCRPTASFLAGVILPLCLMLDCPTSVDREEVQQAIWIRLLRYIIPSHRRVDHGKSVTRSASSSLTRAVEQAISLQIIKALILRASSAIDQVKGLWAYIAAHLSKLIQLGDGHLSRPGLLQAVPDIKLSDFLMWSTYELLSLHRSPLMIHMRHQIQVAILHIGKDDELSQPSSPALDATTLSSPRIPSGHLRMGSHARVVSHLRSPSSPGGHLRSPSGQLPHSIGGTHGRSLSTSVPSVGHAGSNLSPDPAHGRSPSQHMLSPYIPGHSRLPSAGSTAESRRPTFTDLSARRASKPGFSPVLGGPKMHYRFPSSAPVRSVFSNEKGGGAIVHLLAAPNQVLAAPSGHGIATFPLLGLRRTPSDREGEMGSSQLPLDIPIANSELQRQTVRGFKACLIIFGQDVELGEDQPPIKPWSLAEALHHIEEQAKLLIEEEFRTIFASTTMPSADVAKEDVQSLLQGYDVDRAVAEYDAGSEKDSILGRGEDQRALPTFQLSAP